MTWRESPTICAGLLSVSFGLVSPSARVTSVEFQKRHLQTSLTTGPIDRTPGTPGSDKKVTEEDRRGGIAYSSSWKGGFQPLLLFGGISTLLAIKGGFLPN